MPGNRCECLLGRRRSAALGALRVDGPILGPCLETSYRQAHHPGCGVVTILAPDDRDAEIRDGQQHPANAVGSQTAVTESERFALDQQARPISRRAQLAHLMPEPSLPDGEVQVDDRLALHHTARCEDVVATCQRTSRDPDPQPAERVGNTRPSLVHIGNDLQHLRDPA